VTGDVQAANLVVSPGELLSIFKEFLNGDGALWWAYVAGAIDGEFVAEIGVPFAEVEWRFEEFAFSGGGGDDGPWRLGPDESLELFAMVVCDEDAFDVFDADFGEFLEEAAVTKVDEECGVLVADEPDVAGVFPEEEFREAGGVGLCPFAGVGGGGGEQEEYEEVEQTFHWGLAGGLWSLVRSKLITAGNKRILKLFTPGQFSEGFFPEFLTNPA
jgi:hypothetical protein